MRATATVIPFQSRAEREAERRSAELDRRFLAWLRRSGPVEKAAMLRLMHRVKGGMAMEVAGELFREEVLAGIG